MCVTDIRILLVTMSSGQTCLHRVIGHRVAVRMETCTQRDDTYDTSSYKRSYFVILCKMYLNIEESRRRSVCIKN